MSHYSSPVLLLREKSNSICGELAVVEKKNSAAGMCYYVSIQGIHPQKALLQS